MQLRRAAVGVALVAMVVVTGCGRGADSGGGEAAVPQSADQAAGGAPGQAAGGAADQAAPAAAATEARESDKGGSAGSTGAAAQVRLVDLGNRVVRTASVDLEVGEGDLNKTINDATDVVLQAKGLYVGSSTSVPEGEPASGQVTFRVPVDAFEPVLRRLKELGTYRGEKSSTEDVTNQYVDLNGQLAAWRAQERVYLRLLDRARSVTDVIAVQNQLQQVQSNIERLQGQLNHLEDQSSFSTIVLQLTEPGAGGPAPQPTGRLARAWATAVNGLGVMAAAVLVAVVWLTPVVVLAGLVLVGVRALRRPRPVSG
jgi:Domain of unknown function (DUF4349)